MQTLLLKIRIDSEQLSRLAAFINSANNDIWPPKGQEFKDNPNKSARTWQFVRLLSSHQLPAPCSFHIVVLEIVTELTLSDGENTIQPALGEISKLFDALMIFPEKPKVE